MTHIIIPQAFFDKLKQINNQHNSGVHSLETGFTNIIKSGKSNYEKVIAYIQLLEQFLKEKDERQDIPIPVRNDSSLHEPTPMQLSDEAAYAYTKNGFHANGTELIDQNDKNDATIEISNDKLQQYDLSDVLRRTLPKTYLNKALRLYSFLETIPENKLSWRKDGQIRVDSVEIKDSNLYDLLHYSVLNKKLRKKTKPNGWDSFYMVLKNMRVPSFLVNPPSFVQTGLSQEESGNERNLITLQRSVRTKKDSLSKVSHTNQIRTRNNKAWINYSE